MVANPEEGRLSSEDQAEQLRQARKQTTQMKRQYRDMRREKDAEAKAQRWAERHKAVHEDTYDDLEKISGGGRPLNRAGRRKFAKKMNVFKTPDGWQHFNNHYGNRFGKREPLVKKNQKAQVEYASNIQQAMAAAKVTPKKEEK